MRSLGERSEPRRSWMGGAAALPLVRMRQERLLPRGTLPSILVDVVRRHLPSQPSPARGEGVHRALAKNSQDAGIPHLPDREPGQLIGAFVLDVPRMPLDPVPM